MAAVAISYLLDGPQETPQARQSPPQIECIERIWMQAFPSMGSSLALQKQVRENAMTHNLTIRPRCVQIE